LLELIQQALHVSQVGLCKHCRNQCRHGSGFGLPQSIRHSTAQTIEQTHGVPLSINQKVDGGNACAAIY
jgi:hypothetical protein